MQQVGDDCLLGCDFFLPKQTIKQSSLLHQEKGGEGGYFRGDFRPWGPPQNGRGVNTQWYITPQLSALVLLVFSNRVDFFLGGFFDEFDDVITSESSFGRMYFWNFFQVSWANGGWRKQSPNHWYSWWFRNPANQWWISFINSIIEDFWWSCCFSSLLTGTTKETSSFLRVHVSFSLTTWP